MMKESEMKVIDVRNYKKDLELAEHDMKLFRQLGYHCAIKSIVNGHGVVEYVLTARNQFPNAYQGE